mmetsp:Transcript_40137/g.90075  ORF Transcript_40137/g.90075 Transcript_40137/m.90075 type:complete len:234 (+) Transcript_40137:2092-2793(+)
MGATGRPRGRQTVASPRHACPPSVPRKAKALSPPEAASEEPDSEGGARVKVASPSLRTFPPHPSPKASDMTTVYCTQSSSSSVSSPTDDPASAPTAASPWSSSSSASSSSSSSSSPWLPAAARWVVALQWAGSHAVKRARTARAQLSSIPPCPASASAEAAGWMGGGCCVGGAGLATPPAATMAPDPACWMAHSLSSGESLPPHAKASITRPQGRHTDASDSDKWSSNKRKSE